MVYDLFHFSLTRRRVQFIGHRGGAYDMASVDQWNKQADAIMSFSFLGFVLGTLPLTWQLEGTVFVNFCYFGVYGTHLTKSSLERWMFTVRLLVRVSLPHPIYQPLYLAR